MSSAAVSFEALSSAVADAADASSLVAGWRPHAASKSAGISAQQSPRNK
jgi:hypothetical protein